MTERKKKTLKAINARLRILRQAELDAASSGVASATISAGGNSQSYTRIPLADLRLEIASLEKQKMTILRGGTRRTSPDFDIA